MITEEARAETEALELFGAFLADNADCLRPVAHFGDGRGGYLVAMLLDALGIEPSDLTPRRDGKARIPANLARQVMERDAYRCRHCGTHLALTCDHVVAESKGGPTTLENLQTLCQPCNSRKGAA